MNSIRILGIDPGLERTGWAIVENSRDKRPHILDSGIIETSSKEKLQLRLKKIYTEIEKILKTHSPSSAALEDIFFSKRADTQKNTTYARGVILLALENYNIETQEYNPRTVKSSICSNGNADKKQIMKSVQLIFGLKEPLLPDDVSDAAAIAFLHLRNSSFKRLLSGSYTR